MTNAYLDALLGHIATRPDATFCVQVTSTGETRLCWRDLGAAMGRFAAAYGRCELEPGAQVMIFLRHVPDLYGSFFGAMAAGLTPAFMPCSSPRQDALLYWGSHQALLQRIAPGAIVTDRATLAEMQSAGLDFGRSRIVLIEETTPAPLTPVDVPVEAIALLQHSSGTTGLKKGVALSYAAVLGQVERYGRAIGVTADDAVASWLPLYHDMGLIACMILPAFFGIPTVHIDPFVWIGRPALLFEAIDRHGGTLCWLPNFAFEHLALTVGRRAADYDLRRVRAFISCSEPVKAASFARFAAAFAPSGVTPEQLQCCYAMAETVFAAAQTPLGEELTARTFTTATLARGETPTLSEAGEGTLLLETGRALDDVEISVHDEAGRLLPPGRVGEIALRCPFLFTGYNRDPGTTGERLRDGLYFTRDIGFLHDGRLYVLGRQDDMIIVNGRNLYAHEIEAELADIPGLKPGRAVAVGAFDPRVGSAAVVILAERRGDAALDNQAISRQIVSRIVSVFEVTPRAVELMPEGSLIKTTSGKISRSENLKRYVARQEEQGRT